MSNGDGVRHVEADELHETHASTFQLAGTGKEYILTVGEIQLSVTEDGQGSVDEIVYDTKIRMDPQTAAELQQLLENTLSGDSGGNERPDGARGVQ